MLNINKTLNYLLIINTLRFVILVEGSFFGKTMSREKRQKSK